MARSKGVTALRLAREAPSAEIPPVAIANAAAFVAGGAIETRPFQQIELSDLNPRKRIDDAEIAALADSILAKGVLQNLVVPPRPEGRWPDQLEVAAGERRWRAIAKLIAAGRVGADYPVPVRIVPMSDVELVELAMTENLHRRDMTPFEEADGFAWLVEHGRDAETVAAETGYRLPLIRQRLGLHHRVAPAVRQAYEAGELTLGQVQAFTVGDHERQAEILPSVAMSPLRYDAAEIRGVLTEKFIPLSRAMFPRERYKGPRRRDLFHDEEFAEDRAEFARLQGEWAEEKRAELAATWAWAELQRGGYVALRRFGRDDSPKIAGAIVHLRDDLKIEIHTGLVRPAPAQQLPSAFPAKAGTHRAAASHNADKVPPASSAAVAAPADPDRAPFTKAHLIWARQEKTRRLQLAVAANPAVAASLAIMGLIGSQEVRLGRVYHFRQTAGSISSEDRISRDDRIENRPLRAQIEAALKRLNGDTTPTEAVLFRRLLAMPGVDRRALLALLVAECAGTWAGHDPELGDTPLAIVIARACGLDAPGEMPAAMVQAVDGVAPFTMSTAYLERLDKRQLVRVGRSAGVAKADMALSRDALIDLIALSPDYDPRFSPPELRFGTRADLLRAIIEIR